MTDDQRDMVANAVIGGLYGLLLLGSYCGSYFVANTLFPIPRAMLYGPLIAGAVLTVGFVAALFYGDRFLNWLRDYVGLIADLNWNLFSNCWWN